MKERNNTLSVADIKRAIAYLKKHAIKDFEGYLIVPECLTDDEIKRVQDAYPGWKVIRGVKIPCQK